MVAEEQVANVGTVHTGSTRCKERQDLQLSVDIRAHLHCKWLHRTFRMNIPTTVDTNLLCQPSPRIRLGTPSVLRTGRN